MEQEFSILYIIGNGFDIDHGIKSSYCDFYNWTKIHNTSLLDELSRYYYIGDPKITQKQLNKEWYLWGDFENNLELLNDDYLLHISDSFDNYGTDNAEDQSYDVVGPVIQKELKHLKAELQEYFQKWILDIDIDIDIKPMVKFNNDSFFLSFNYTSTLQKVYNISEKDILHIHNKANRDDKLIFGHGRLHAQYYSELFNSKYPRHNGVYEDINSYCRFAFYKNTQEISEYHSWFFQNLSNIRHICIFGHSLSKIDMPYFQKIMHNIDSSKVVWYISYYRNEYKEKDNFEEVEDEKAIARFQKELAISNDKIVRFNSCDKRNWPNIMRKNNILVSIE